MRMPRVVACAVLAVILAGCDLVTSERPIGLPFEVGEEDWAGTWLPDDGALTVRVADAGKGILEVGWVEEKQGDLVLETVEVHLGRFEDWTFASFAGVEDVPGFLWSRLGREEDRLFLWWPRPAELARLVEEGLLPGTVEDGDVSLGPLEAAHLAILVSEDHGVLYDWDEPMTFRRLR